LRIEAHTSIAVATCMQRLLLNRVTGCAAAIVLAQGVTCLAGDQQTEPAVRLGISLSPAVVMLSGQPGQAHRQTLRLTNHTSKELTFTLEAQDVLAEGGRRVFLPAGERLDSIAATAVFTPRELVIPPGTVGSADVILTVPPQTAVRAVAAVFRGHTPVNPRVGVAMTASLGCLITFTLSDDARLEASQPEVSAQTDTANLFVGKWVTNVGSEPLTPSGAVALLNDAGVLVGKMPVEMQRVLPGERLRFGAEYPTLLAQGRYRAILSLEYGERVLTNALDFIVQPAAVDRRATLSRAGPRP
jgi:hypothetical protein